MPIDGGNVPSPAAARPMTAYEREQIGVERLKAWLTAGSIITAVAAAVLTYASTQSAQRRQTAASFQLKAAEIVMASRTPWEAQGKARALATFFPNDMPAAMATDSFNPVEHVGARIAPRVANTPSHGSQHSRTSGRRLQDVESILPGRFIVG